MKALYALTLCLICYSYQVLALPFLDVYEKAGPVLYPNPIESGGATIRFPGDFIACFYDQLGELVYSVRGTEKAFVSEVDLGQGVFLLVIKNLIGEEMETVKVVVK